MSQNKKPFSLYDPVDDGIFTRLLSPVKQSYSVGGISNIYSDLFNSNFQNMNLAESNNNYGSSSQTPTQLTLRGSVTPSN
ncbi:Hypothetical protein KVN_LOCUS526 [uncultured virus]|nr:Hypothetical protein KVN_LOCUS526 [uncultured virus]